MKRSFKADTVTNYRPRSDDSGLNTNFSEIKPAEPIIPQVNNVPVSQPKTQTEVGKKVEEIKNPAVPGAYLKEYLADYIVKALSELSDSNIVQWSITIVAGILSILAGTIVLVNAFGVDKLLSLGPLRVVINVITKLPIQLVAVAGYVFALITKVKSDTLHMLSSILISFATLAYGIKFGYYLMVIASIVMLFSVIIRMGLLDGLIKQYEFLRQLFSFFSIIVIALLVADFVFSYNQSQTFKKGQGEEATILEQIRNLT